jgi:hypothetical protein
VAERRRYCAKATELLDRTVQVTSPAVTQLRFARHAPKFGDNRVQVSAEIFDSTPFVPPAVTERFGHRDYAAVPFLLASRSLIPRSNGIT